SFLPDARVLCSLSRLASIRRPPPRSTLVPYTTLFRSALGTPGRIVEQLAGNPHVRRSVAAGNAEAGIARCLAERQPRDTASAQRSEEHTSELQSHLNLVCRLLLEKKNITAVTARVSTD